MKNSAAISVGALIFIGLPQVTLAQQTTVSAIDPDLAARDRTVSISPIPPLPSGKSTIMGGAIRDVDPVLDRFTLFAIGDKPLRVLFDERTQIFLDGKKIPLHDLRAAQHASVQTTLDGTSVFAISIHVLSQSNEGEFSGQVVSYSAQSGDLVLASGPGGPPFRVHVSDDTRISRSGQDGFASAGAQSSDLQRGSLVSVQFLPNGKGSGQATEITFLATPGSQFVFSGTVIALDMRSGTLVLLDPRNGQSYQIAFTPEGTPGLHDILNGQHLRVSAQFDGTRYLAREVTPY